MRDEEISRQADRISLFAGLIFIAHPVQVEAVTYISQRSASMATLFYVASLCFYIKSRSAQTEIPHSVVGRIYYAGALTTAVIAMFTKETAITLPLMILLYEISFLKTDTKPNWKYLAPFLATLIIVPLGTDFTKSVKFHLLLGEPEMSSMQYFLTQFRVMITYIRLVFLPFCQNLDYDYHIFKDILEAPVMVSVLFLATILFSVKCLFTKYRLIAFSILWFFLTLLPESSIFPIKDVIFEHRLYLPMVGFSLFLVSGIYYIWGKNSSTGMTAILCLIVLSYSVMTYQRNIIWKDDQSLWDDTVRKSPYKARPYINRGISYCRLGELDRSWKDLNKGIGINPNFAISYFYRGLIYEKQGRPIQALIEFSKAITIEPRNPLAYYKRCFIYKSTGDIPRCLSDLYKINEIDPQDTMAYDFRGIVFIEQGKLIQAIAEFNKSIDIDPNDRDAYKYRARAYSLLERSNRSGS